MRPARIGLIGARRRRQGLGPFVARGLREAGAEVPCFLATRPETVEPAATALDQHAGVRARGYVELSRMIESEDIDALAVLSPAPTHETYLSAATAAGLHALCEKPLIWGGDGLASRAAIAADEFAARGLLLQENCQWPYTLPAFRALHPDALDAPVERLAMRLSPTSSGIEMLGDALSHPLSLLQALIPEDGPSIERPRFERSTRGEGEAIRVEFGYCAGSCLVAVTVDLAQSREVPREAGLTINGRTATRRVQMPDYAQRFEDGHRTVPVPDPLDARLRDFVRVLDRVRAGDPPPASSEIAERMLLVESLVVAFLEAGGGS